MPVILAKMVGRVWEGIRKLFLSKVEIARRTVWRFEALKRKTSEAERLDRLRNPSNYRGK